MRQYIHATEGAFFFLVVFIVLVFVMPEGRVSAQVELLLTISTFLFAVLAGFYLSRLNTRYDRVRELIAEEDAHWLSVYELSATLGKKHKEAAVEIIDEYYRASFDYYIGESHRPTQKLMDSFYALLRAVRVSREKDEKEKNAYESSLDLLANIEVTRNEVSVLSREKLTPGQWATMLVLAIIVLFSIFYLKGNAFFSDAIVVLLATVLALVLLVMRDLQNFLLGGTSMVEESSQQVFEVIGRPRYYPKNHLVEHCVEFPRDTKNFRVGYHDVYADPNSRAHIKLAKVGDFGTKYRPRGASF